MDITCTQQATQSSKLNADMQQQASQMASSVTTALSLNPGSSQANNIMALSLSVGEAITNVTEQLIAPATAAAQSAAAVAHCRPDGTGGNATINNFQQTAYTNTIMKGLQESTQVSSAVAKLKQAASQTATAKQTGLFSLGNIAIVIAVIAIAFIAKKFMGKRHLGGDGAETAMYVKCGLGLAALAAVMFTLDKKTSSDGFCQYGADTAMLA